MAIIEKVLHCLQEENKDVRKGDWNAKEVRRKAQGPEDDKECTALEFLTQLVEDPEQGPNEIHFFSDLPCAAFF